MSLYPAGQVKQTSLTGAELVEVDGGGAVKSYTTTAAIAALASDTSAGIVETAITTVGNGTLTGPALVGGQIARSGPTGAYTDTTATAAQIVAALPEFALGATFFVTIKNATAYAETLAAGSNVTLPATVIIGPFQEARYFATLGGTAASPTVTFTHIYTVSIAASQSVNSPQLVAINTVGAGVISAAAIAGGLIARGGSQSGAAFTDAADTAAAIIAACVGLVNKIGSTMTFELANNTNAVETLSGGTNVTWAGVTVIPPNTIAQFQVNVTGAATVTITGLGATQSISTGVTIAGATSGYAEIIPTAIAGATTSTLPPTTGVLASTSAANLNITDIYRCTTIQTANANVTPATITGLSGAVAVGTYDFEASIYCTIASGTGGVAINQLLTTAVLSSCNFQATGFTSAAAATQATTTATSGTVLFTQAAVILEIVIKGTFVVSTAGTFALQMCQSASNASNSSVNVGSTMRLTRIA